MKRALLVACWGLVAVGVAWAQTTPPIRLIDAYAPFYDPARTPPNSWAMPFGHLDLLEAPYVATEHLEASLARFDAYCAHVARRGYTSVIVGNVIHLVTFDGVEGGPIYAPGSPHRARADAYKAAFTRACQIAAGHGLKVAVDTDFPTWTPPLLEWLGEGGVRVDNPRLWEATRAAVEELFGEVGVWALHVRIGEGGGAYDEATGYRSAVAVRDVPGVQAVVRGLLEQVEAYNAAHPGADRKLLFRTWTIGIGEVGALHTDPALYRRVFDDFAGRPALVTLIKYVALDFFQHVPLNPTIGVGPVQQVVEFQARREYEGFGLFPNYRAEPFQEALRVFAAQETFAGISVWPTNGGFLMDSPTYYRSQGVDDWIDQNVHAYAQLLDDPEREPAALAAAWAREQGLPPEAAERYARILLASDDVIGRGMYLVPYAEHAPALFGVDVFPTMLWIYWTRPIGAYGPQALVTPHASAELERCLEDGRWAVAELARLEQEAAALPAGEVRARLQAALAYERSGFEVFAAYRAVLLPHYRWVRDGDGAAYDAWQAALPALAQAVAAHEAAYGADRRLPAWDLRELHRVLHDDAWIPTLRPLAGLVGLLAWLTAGACLLGLNPTPRGPAWLRRAPLLFACAGVSGAGLAGLQTVGAGGVLGLALGALLACAPGLLALALLALPVRRRDEQAGVPWTVRCAACLAPGLVVTGWLALGFAWRGPAWGWTVVADALLGDGGARALLALGLALGGLGTVACWALAGRLALGRSGPGLGVAVGGVVLSAALGGAAWAAGGIPAALAVADALRLTPTFLDKAGTGVADLVGEGGE
ncbi:MAG: hypothetical protein R3F62_15120 [Planctomycetota bacterium]